MKYKVRCNGCGRQFMIEATDSGRHRYRCPYCNKVVLCQVNIPDTEPVRTRATATPPPACDTPKPSRTARTSKAVMQKTTQGARWFAGRISRFRAQNKNADLWLFFIFSILYIVSVIIGLLVCAETAKLIAQGKSWLFRLWLDFKHW